MNSFNERLSLFASLQCHRIENKTFLVIFVFFAMKSSTKSSIMFQEAKVFFPVFIFGTFFRISSILLSLTYLNDFAFLPMGLIWIANLIIAILGPGAQGNLQVSPENLVLLTY